jgi:peptidyl-prolyl cis-trans isomerase SurA
MAQIFSLKAYAFSEDPGSSSEFGKLGWIERGELVPEFEAVAFRLKEGELSEPVQTPFGYHLIIVDEKRGNKLNLRHILIKPKIAAQDLTLIKNRMDSVLHELSVDSLSWREAVSQYSEEEQSKSVGGLMTNTKNGTAFFEKADIDGTLIFTIDQMKVGQYSAVLPYSTQNRQTGEMISGYRIIWLKSETKPHQASFRIRLSQNSKCGQIRKATKTTRRVGGVAQRPQLYSH